MAAIYVFITNN